MKVTYNKDHVGDTLFVTFKKTETPSYEYYNDLTVIKDGAEIIGLNIFKASEQLSFKNEINIEPTEKLVSDINTVLSKNGVEEVSPDLSPKFVVGFVKEKEAHPDADKLNVCQVDTGSETLQIVCGAPNVDAGQKVVVAKVGAIMPGGLYIKPAKLRGVDSNGMICSKKELNLEDDGIKGIYVLDDGFTVGQTFEVG
ncbi:YtpR family tRNA-binding protein [Corticicoccus populi]|uniref:YtpR family tRNA-binding protein n=1 Tax=Corticicoccus populi TaxID=1812821 RepID=A0ABW5WQC1_9STAP